MTVAEFKSFLLELALLYKDAGNDSQATALEKLAELFDGTQNLKVTTFVEQIRRARKMRAA